MLGELVRDIALVAERERLPGQHEREHEVRIRERSRKTELEPERQRPLHAQLQHAHDHEQQRRNPRAEEDSAAASAVQPDEHRGGDQHRDRHQQQHRQRILDPPAARDDRRDRARGEAEEDACGDAQRAVEARRPARELEEQPRERDVERDREQRGAPGRTLRHRREPVHDRDFVADAEDVELVEHEEQHVGDEIRIHALAQRKEEREHHQQRRQLERRKQHVEPRARKIAGAVVGDVAHFDAARYRALGFDAKIDRVVLADRRGQDHHDRVARVAGIARIAVDAARLHGVCRRRVDIDVQADRIEYRERRRAWILPVGSEADAIPDVALARWHDRGVRLRLEVLVVRAGDDARGRRRFGGSIHALDDQRHRRGACGSRREYRDECRQQRRKEDS